MANSPVSGQHCRYSVFEVNAKERPRGSHRTRRINFRDTPSRGILPDLKPEGAWMERNQASGWGVSSLSPDPGKLQHGENKVISLSVHTSS